MFCEIVSIDLEFRSIGFVNPSLNLPDMLFCLIFTENHFK